VGAYKSVFERQQTLLSVVGGASIGTLDGLFLTPGYTLFELIDDKGKQERYGKDRDKEVHNQADIRGYASPQALHPDAQALPHP
jgi:hypothetical protein